MANFNLLTAFGPAFLVGAIELGRGRRDAAPFPTLIWLGLNSVTANATSFNRINGFLVTTLPRGGHLALTANSPR